MTAIPRSVQTITLYIKIKGDFKMLNLKDFIDRSKKFAEDTKDSVSYNMNKHYTTDVIDGWSETTDNEHGGMDVTWAFHLTESAIEKLAPEEHKRQIEEEGQILLDAMVGAQAVYDCLFVEDVQEVIRYFKGRGYRCSYDKTSYQLTVVLSSI